MEIASARDLLFRLFMARAPTRRMQALSLGKTVTTLLRRAISPSNRSKPLGRPAAPCGVRLRIENKSVSVRYPHPACHLASSSIPDSLRLAPLHCVQKSRYRRPKVEETAIHKEPSRSQAQWVSGDPESNARRKEEPAAEKPDIESIAKKGLRIWCGGDWITKVALSYSRGH